MVGSYERYYGGASGYITGDDSFERIILHALDNWSPEGEADKL
jgi:hypothetical protein